MHLLAHRDNRALDGETHILKRRFDAGICATPETEPEVADPEFATRYEHLLGFLEHGLPRGTSGSEGLHCLDLGPRLTIARDVIDVERTTTVADFDIDSIDTTTQGVVQFPFEAA